MFMPDSESSSWPLCKMKGGKQEYGMAEQLPEAVLCKLSSCLAQRRHEDCKVLAKRHHQGTDGI